MALTEKYDLEEIDYGTTGWNGIQTNNNEIIDENMQTRLIYELGENVSAYQAVYINTDSKAWLAQANGTKQPSIGLMVEDGTVGETDKRIQRVGEIINVSWTWASIGKAVYLSPTTPGALTQTPSGANAQIMGIAITATKILLTSIWQSSLVGDQPYIVGGGYTGSPTSSLVMVRHPITTEEPTFPSALAGSKMVAGTAATAEAVFSIKKNGVEFGTATFAISGTVASFAAPSSTKLNEDDVLTVVAPASPDATLADLGLSLLGTRSTGTTTTTTTTTTSSTTTTTTAP